MFYKIIFTLLILTIASNKIMATSIKDILSESEYECKKVVIPTSEFTKNNTLELLSSIKRGDFDVHSIEDLELDAAQEKTIKDWISEKLNLGQIKNKISNAQLKEDHPFDVFAKISSYSNPQKEKADALIKEFLIDQQRNLLWRVNRFMKNVELMAQKNPTNLLIFVLPEAFFNYFNNPNGVGNFIPFSSKDIFFKKIKTFSEQYSNTLLVGNFVYASKESEIRAFSEDFNDFSAHSYNQENIIKKYNAQRHRLQEDQDTKMIPIFNESFFLFKGKEILSHKKRFILDEDIPLEYLDSLVKKKGWSYPVYTPGNKDQSKLDDFYIEICQDHAMIPDKKKSKITFIQSASVDVNAERLKNKTDGLFIHSDIQPETSKVFEINTETKHITVINKEEVEIPIVGTLENRIKELESLGVDFVSSEFLCNIFWEKENIKKWRIYDVSAYLK